NHAVAPVDDGLEVAVVIIGIAVVGIAIEGGAAGWQAGVGEGSDDASEPDALGEGERLGAALEGGAEDEGGALEDGAVVGGVGDGNAGSEGALDVVGVGGDDGKRAAAARDRDIGAGGESAIAPGELGGEVGGSGEGIGAGEGGDGDVGEGS